MPYTISEILSKAREIIETNEEIGGYILIQGEVGTFKVYGKHAYLNLKEENAMLKCVYFMIPLEIASRIKEGMVVEVYGYLSIYEDRGEFQFYIKSLKEISKSGLLQLEYEKIKQKLIMQGIIPKPPEAKRALPEHPANIAVITSRHGAAIHDVLKTIEKRYPVCTVSIFHTGVQGKVEKEIAQAISQADDSISDILIVVRGGGSMEDLWCFNTEIVVKAVRKSKKPIIVGVGHETDHTLCEYAADYIASTPTAAAVIATPDIASMIESKRITLEKISLLTSRKNTYVEESLNNLMNVIRSRKLLKNISDVRRQTESKFERLSDYIDMKMTQRCQRLQIIFKTIERPAPLIKIKTIESKLTLSREKIESNNPEGYLEKGFVRVEKAGKIVNSVVQLKKGDTVQIRLKDGKAESKITLVKKDKSDRE